MKEHFGRQLRGYSNNPTYGEMGARAFLKRIPDEEFPNNVSFNPKFQGHNSYEKRTRFNKGILENYLNSKVGQHWNDIRQDICSVSVPRTNDGWRNSSLYTKFENMVELQPYIVKGVAYCQHLFVKRDELRRLTGFYLDENYILRVQTKRQRYGTRNVSTTKDRILEKNGKKYSVLNGFWHEMVEETIISSKRTPTHESMKEYHIHGDPARLEWIVTPTEHVSVNYRQLSKRELRRLNIYNKNTFMSQEQKELGFTKYNDLKEIPPRKSHNNGW